MQLSYSNTEAYIADGSVYISYNLLSHTQKHDLTSISHKLNNSGALVTLINCSHIV